MKTKIISIVLALLLYACVPASTPSTETPSTNPNTPPTVEATVPIAGDLGFGKISGKVTDSATGALIAESVTCKHSSYTSKEADHCYGSANADQDGAFLFENIFFHDTDTIILIVDAAGYKPTSMKYISFTQPLLEADIKLSK
jgi:hypothetical protein